MSAKTGTPKLALLVWIEQPDIGGGGDKYAYLRGTIAYDMVDSNGYLEAPHHDHGTVFNGYLEVPRYDHETLLHGFQFSAQTDSGRVGRTSGWYAPRIGLDAERHNVVTLDLAKRAVRALGPVERKLAAMTAKYGAVNVGAAWVNRIALAIGAAAVYFKRDNPQHAPTIERYHRVNVGMDTVYKVAAMERKLRDAWGQS